jgi:GTP-binding protein LepA
LKFFRRNFSLKILTACFDALAHFEGEMISVMVLIWLSLLVFGYIEAFVPSYASIRSFESYKIPVRSSKGSESSSLVSEKRSSLRMEIDRGLVWKYDASKIRNFCIVAHIDHGKSTLADRLLEYTKTVAMRDMQNQLLDSLDIERERGITVKLQAARMLYKARDGEVYLLNLIDTPGHVDFGYEVSRSLAACEGALLVVDAAQGVEAQTMANVYLALENELEIIPVVNKIDLPAADPVKVCEEVESTIGLDCSDAILASAKTGIGIEDILEAIVERIPPPKYDINGMKSVDKPLRALIFDSYYDTYRGVVTFFRVVDGKMKRGDKIRFLASAREYDIVELGVMTPVQKEVDELNAGELGYFAAGIKELDHARVGDTIASSTSWQDVGMLPGYEPAKPMVYCGLYPSESDDYGKLRDAITKLKLNDAALTYVPETSSAMGFGFRCGFLGLLHMDIVQERLEREFDVNLIVTAPSVVYMIKNGIYRSDKNNKDIIERYIDTPAKLPDPSTFDEILEPYVRLEIMTPTDYTGSLMELGQSRRGIYQEMKYLTPTRSILIYNIPLAEVITDFFDQLKSRSKGYASMSYQEIGYRSDKLVKLDIRINDEDAPPLASIVHRDKAHDIGKAMCLKLKSLIPRQQFKVPIQACIGAKPIASAQISALSKDVLAKCYGGDISRKKKLLQKQAKGKKRMKAMGKVNVPQEAFMAVISINQDNNL